MSSDPGRPGPTSAWGEVRGRADRVLIVASGPSAAGLDPDLVTKAAKAGVYVLAVKGAIRWLQVCHGWVTVDPNRRCREMITDLREGVQYFAAVPDDYGSNRAKLLSHRVERQEGVTYLRRSFGEGLSEDPGSVTTGNSAFAALGIAYHMRPSRVAMVGVDGTPFGYAHLEGNPRGRFDHLPSLFATAYRQLTRGGIRVVNGSPSSQVACFPRTTPNEAVKWISSRRAERVAPMLKLLVLGGAACVWDDAEAAMEMAEFDAVLACKDMIADWPGRLDYGVSLHPERCAEYLRERKRKGYLGRPQIWVHKNHGSRRAETDCSIEDWGGSSGLFGVRVGIEEGFGRIVLAGVPMTADAGHYKRGEPWTECRKYTARWEARADDLRGAVRSMSGWTAELLGRPTTDWLNDN